MPHRTRGSAQQQRRRAAIAAAALLPAAALLYAATRHTAVGGRVDGWFWAAPGDPAAHTFTAGHLFGAAIPLAALVLAALVLCVRDRRTTLAAVLTVATAVLAVSAIKHGLRLLEPAAPGARPVSFPSGHVAAVFALASGITWFLPGRLRAPAAAIAGAATGAVATAALAIHAHRMSDVAGAILVTSAVGTAWRVVLCPTAESYGTVTRGLTVIGAGMIAALPLVALGRLGADPVSGAALLGAVTTSGLAAALAPAL